MRNDANAGHAARGEAAHEAMRAVRDMVAKGALSMIDHANHKPENRGVKPKVGGHQASSMSSVDLLMALYLDALRPGDRLAIKPHAAPVLYALMHLMGLLPRAAMNELREYKGPQPYPTELKNPRFVDYTTSSEGLGCACTIYDAYGAKHFDLALSERLRRPKISATYWAHVGDGELTEGQIDESLYDAGRWRLDNLVWIVDLNRQSLDRVMDDSGQLARWVRLKFEAQGWEVIELRWGSEARALFAREGGEHLRAWLERLDDALFHPLLLLSEGDLAALLAGETPASPALAALFSTIRARAPLCEEAAAALRALARRESGIARSLAHLGGHDLEALSDAYQRARAVDRPVCIVAHTVKGHQTSGAAHPENHGGLLPSDEVRAWGIDRGLPAGEPFPVPRAGSAEHALVMARRALLFEPEAAHAYAPAPLDVRAVLASVPQRARTVVSTGEVFQSLNLALTRGELGPYLQFGAPDVGQTTHLGPVIKQGGVFSPRALPDVYAFMRETGALSFDWRPSATGQFHAFGIAEGNAMLWAYAFGRRKKVIEGKVPLLPVVTVYDKFFERGFNQLDYAVYSNARFIAVGVPSGTGLSRETATHQSIQTPRMMMDLPGILAYEPAFSADLHAIYLHALARLWDEDGEAFYLRLTTQPIAQPARLPEHHAEHAIKGAYWLVGEDARDGDGREVILVATGRKLAEAREAGALLAREGIGSRILNVTSYEALWRDWDAYRNDPEAWQDPTRSYHLHDLFSEREVNLPMVVVGDFVPSVAEWLPTALMRVSSHRFLGPRHNGEAGDLRAIDRHHGMGVDDIVRVAKEELAWRERARGAGARSARAVAR